MESIPKGLTMGRDNWADSTPEGMARASLRNDGAEEFRAMVAKALPNASEEETIMWLKEYFENIVSQNPIMVNAVCTFQLFFFCMH